MLLNLTDVLTSEGKQEEKEILFEADLFQYGGESFTITKKDPVHITVSALEKGKAYLKGSAKFSVCMYCDRCLKETIHEFDVTFDRMLYAPDYPVSEESLEEGYDLVGFQIDIEELVTDEISVNWPMKVLCKPDCKGICSICGKNLNDGACGCDTFIPDPRMAKIKDIFNEGKEV